LSQAYPLGQFLIFEAYNGRYRNTGYTYDTDNDLPHTVVSGQVDINFLPIIGLSVKIDVGVTAYVPGENGGIAGTVTYDVTRNEFDPAYSAQEDYQPGVPGIPMQLWRTQKDVNGDPVTYPGSGAVKQFGRSKTTGADMCERPDGLRGTNAVTDPSQDCKPYDYYVTESWTRPTGCMALDVYGNKLEGELALPEPPATIDYSHSDPTQPDCLEAPMNGVQVGGDGSVDGNYALASLIKADTLTFGDPENLEEVYANAQGDPALSDPMPSDDYVAEAVNPVDTVNSVSIDEPDMGGFSGVKTKRLYRFTDETSIDVMTGDTYVPQDGYTDGGDPEGPAWNLSTSQDNVRQDHNTFGAGTVAKCAGTMQTIVDDNEDLAGGGGSPYVGQTVPVCDA
ncbi:MAG: hypothetical protein Q8M17_14260, partial [Actinomycetota bacterium]|nr:hypothetical protein [Actinomycetota bacterium]